jgi:transcriptional regulator with XRE-family HTH domain
VITLTAERRLGPLLRRLRLDAGLTVRQAAALMHVSRSAVAKREASHGMPTDTFAHAAHVLGFDLALIPRRHPGARPTGTGWPA